MNTATSATRQDESPIDGLFDSDDLDAFDAALADDTRFLAELAASGERSPEYLDMLHRVVAMRRCQLTAKKIAAKRARLAAMLDAMIRLVAGAAHMIAPVLRVEATQRSRQAAGGRSADGGDGDGEGRHVSGGAA